MEKGCAPRCGGKYYLCVRTIISLLSAGLKSSQFTGMRVKNGKIIRYLLVFHRFTLA